MAEGEVARMSVAGWAFLAVSWISITALAAFCIARVLKSDKKAGADETPLD
ncbi:MAG TPA: hypothetical protein VMX94_02855 [Armatimonadota bacterium]|nr:hypothetical protein [Armatimonadota bacterium]